MVDFGPNAKTALTTEDASIQYLFYLQYYFSYFPPKKAMKKVWPGLHVPFNTRYFTGFSEVVLPFLRQNDK